MRTGEEKQVARLSLSERNTKMAGQFSTSGPFFKLFIKPSHLNLMIACLLPCSFCVENIALKQSQGTATSFTLSDWTNFANCSTCKILHNWQDFHSFRSTWISIGSSWSALHFCFWVREDRTWRFAANSRKRRESTPSFGVLMTFRPICDQTVRQIEFNPKDC